MDIVENIFENLNKNGVRYEADYKKNKLKKLLFPIGVNELGYADPAKYPEGLIKKINIQIDKRDEPKFSKIMSKFGFIFFPEKGKEYFRFDKSLGLICIKIISAPEKKADFNGRLICFVGPEGSGKTSTLSAVYTFLENFPVRKKFIIFSSFKDSKIWRIYDLSKKLIICKFKNKKMILADRYIYLTFRGNAFLRKLFRFIAPRPDLVFIMKCDYKNLKKRRGPICSSEENVKKMYSLFGEAVNKIEVDTSKNRWDNLEFIINKILEMYKNDQQ